ncbi:NCAN isoform 4 [Pan troglodytes]|uniref:Neurocan core protein n=1 Tax=Pan troglodytes TaxID=9598 RepID=A0A2J8LSQ5_PANTR|nr:NCAN isoform 4 [Pan troglodytes]
MGTPFVWALGLLMLQMLLFVAGEQGTQDIADASERGLHMQKLGSGSVQAALAELVALPCLFTLQPQPSAARDAPRIKWTKVRTASGQRQDLPILVAKDNVVKVAKSWQGRVSLPSYPRRRANATLLLGPLRASDSGLYRCQVVRGIEDEQDLVPLEVTGVVFHYRSARDRYALTFAEAQEACRLSSAIIAAPRHLQAAFEDGFDNCDAGWLSDRTVRYPITQSRPGCYGDRSSLPGVRSYGRRNPQELYDVYCFARELGGEVFYVGPARRLTLAGARAQCRRQGAALASVGQLHLAWHEGLDQCDPGWLADGSVRYPIQTPRRRCGGPAPGVRTVYRFANRTGFPSPAERFDAYCFRAHHPTSQHGDLETPSSGDEGEILSAEGPPVRELEPTLEEEEVVTPDFQEPLVSSGEEEPLILEEKQESQQTLSPTPGDPILASWPTGEVWLSTVAPSPSDMGAGTAASSHTEVAPTDPMPRRRGRFKGLNGRYFQQQEPEPGLQGGMEASAQPPTSEAAGNQMEPPLAMAVTEMLGSGQSRSPWADLTNEVDMPGAGQGGEAMPTTPESPGADFRETGETSPAQVNKAEHSSSSPWPSVNRNVAVGFVPTETATEPTGLRGISGSESGVLDTAESPTSGLQATVDEVQDPWPSVYSKGLGASSPSAPLGSPGVFLVPKVTPSLEPWVATDEGPTVNPMDSTVTLAPSDASGIWEPGSQVFEEAESTTLSPQVALDTSIVTPLTTLEQGDKVGVPAMSTLGSSSSQPHPEPEDQVETQGTSGASVPPHQSSPLGKPAVPPGTPTAASVGESASVSSGEPTVPWDPSSTLLPVTLGIEDFELEVLAGSPGVESFWEEVASGEEPALPGTPMKAGAEEVHSDPCENNPCLHGGTCNANGTMYGCSCDQGFAGENCEIDIDDCLCSPCENGGTCIDEVNGFVCLCLPSYGGSFCEKGFGHENTWIGLNDRIVERDFQWTDNTGLQFENWRENQPDNFFAGGEDCVVMVAHESGRWNDVPCNYNLPYVCKKGTVENASLIGARKAKYNVHATVRYQCNEGFAQHHVATIRCRSNGKWDRPQIVCTKRK